MAPPSTLTIEELDGDRRRLELAGPSLPFRGAAWPVEQRVVTEWYPGNSEATQHVLGPIDPETSLTGVWNTTRLVRVPAKFFSSPDAPETLVSNAFTLHEVLDDFARAARLLRVTWSADADRRVVRLGRITKYRPEFQRADDVGWSLDLAWVGRGTDQKRAVSVKDESLRPSLVALASAMNDVTAAIETAAIRSARRVGNAATAFSLGDLERLADAPSRLLDRVSRAATQFSFTVNGLKGIADKATNLPRSLATRASATGASVRLSFVGASDEAGRAPFEVGVPPGGRVASTMRARKYQDDAFRQVDRGAASAALLEHVSRARASALADVSGADTADQERAYAVHAARAGETFASIARRFLGSADRGGDVARANGFPAYQVSPPVGASLLIPRLSSVSSPRAV